mmetsp:Transcript_23983/g.42886  ORF Transcript_23983/g.42886 Transcript_23983/m.42886 type:complete len:354 (-) Transcript_23983:35-1096(-)
MPRGRPTYDFNVHRYFGVLIKHINPIRPTVLVPLHPQLPPHPMRSSAKRIKPHDDFIVESRCVQPVHLKAICIIASRLPSGRYSDAQVLVLELQAAHDVEELHERDTVLRRRAVERLAQCRLKDCLVFVNQFQRAQRPSEVDEGAPTHFRNSSRAVCILGDQVARQVDLMPRVDHGQRVEQLGDLGANELVQIRRDRIHDLINIALSEEPELRQSVRHFRQLSGSELPKVFKGQRAKAPEQETSGKSKPGDDCESVNQIPGCESIHLIGHALDNHVHELPVENTPSTECLQQHHALRGLKVVHQLDGLVSDEFHSGHVSHSTHRQRNCHRCQIARIESVLSSGDDLCQTLSQV